LVFPLETFFLFSFEKFGRCCVQRHLARLLCCFLCVSMVERRLFSVSPPTLVTVCPACILLCAILFVVGGNIARQEVLHFEII
jgi:hypothetical protein